MGIPASKTAHSPVSSSTGFPYLMPTSLPQGRSTILGLVLIVAVFVAVLLRIGAICLYTRRAAQSIKPAEKVKGHRDANVKGIVKTCSIKSVLSRSLVEHCQSGDNDNEFSKRVDVASALLQLDCTDSFPQNRAPNGEIRILS